MRSLRENQSRMMDTFLIWEFHSILLYLICDTLLITKYNFAFCSNPYIFHPQLPTHTFFFLLFGRYSYGFILFCLVCFGRLSSSYWNSFCLQSAWKYTFPRWPLASVLRVKEYESPTTLPWIGTTQVVGIVKPTLYFRVPLQIGLMLSNSIFSQFN